MQNFSMRISNYRINIWLSSFFLILYLLPTDTNATLNTWRTFIDPIRYLGLAWAALTFLKIRGYNERRLWPIWIFLFIGCVSTLLNQTDMKSYIRFAYPVVGSCLLIYHILHISGKNAVFKICKLFNAFLIVQGISYLIGGFKTIVDGNGISYTEYFMGQRTSISRILIYAVGLGVYILYFDRRRRDHLFVYLSILLAVYFVISEKVSSAVMSLLVILAVLVIGRIIKSEHVWKNLTIFAFVLCVLFVVADKTPEYFQWLLVDFLGEDMTLNGRTLLWGQALGYMEGWHWVLGNGYGHNYQFFLGTWMTNLTHSQYIGILFNFGIIGLIAYFFLLLSPLLRIKNIRSVAYRKLLVAVTLSSIITGISASFYTSVYLYSFYATCVFLEEHAESSESLTTV